MLAAHTVHDLCNDIHMQRSLWNGVGIKLHYSKIYSSFNWQERVYTGTLFPASEIGG